MGKGTILNNLGDGQYDIVLDIDDSRARDTITDLENSILNYNTIIIELQAQKGTAWAMYDSANSKFNVILNQYIAGTATKEQIVKATADMNAKYRLYIEYDRAWWHAQMQQKSMQKRKEYIENKLAENPEPTVQAWCADLTTDLSGSVGTIEIPNERTNDIQIRPGYGGEAVYSASRDGQLQQVVSSTAAGVYYNYAMFPGWQKWKPTYRVGKITAKPTTDTADVLLDDATSTAQNLDINVSNTLSDVPIVYMDCDGQVFEVDDRVVVEFISQDHTNPRIIGFETDPKACAYNYYAISQVTGPGIDKKIYVYRYDNHNLVIDFITARDTYGLCWNSIEKEIVTCGQGNRVYFYGIDGVSTRPFVDLSAYSQTLYGVEINPAADPDDRDLLLVGRDTITNTGYLQQLVKFTNAQKSKTHLIPAGPGVSYIDGCCIYEGNLIICFLDGIQYIDEYGATKFQSRIRHCNGLDINNAITEWIEDIDDYRARGLGIDPDGNLLSLHWHDTWGKATIRKHAGITSTISEYKELSGMDPTRWEGLTYIL